MPCSQLLRREGRERVYKCAEWVQCFYVANAFDHVYAQHIYLSTSSSKFNVLEMTLDSRDVHVQKQGRHFCHLFVTSHLLYMLYMSNFLYVTKIVRFKREQLGYASQLQKRKDQGGRGGGECSSCLLGVKEVILVPPWVFGVKRSMAGSFAVPFRVLCWVKKCNRRYMYLKINWFIAIKKTVSVSVNV